MLCKILYAKFLWGHSSACPGPISSGLIHADPTSPEWYSFTLDLCKPDLCKCEQLTSPGLRTTIEQVFFGKNMSSEFADSFSSALKHLKLAPLQNCLQTWPLQIREAFQTCHFKAVAGLTSAASTSSSWTDPGWPEFQSFLLTWSLQAYPVNWHISLHVNFSHNSSD